MTKKKPAYDYRLNRFTQEDLAQVRDMIIYCNQALPRPVASFEDIAHSKGWLRPYLLAYEGLLWGRWNYWGQLKLAGTAETSEPIPRLPFLGTPVNESKKMLMDCAEYGMRHGQGVHHFLEWLLWGLGDLTIDSINHVPENVSKYWYERFDLFLVLDQPTDYLSHLLADIESRNSKSLRGYFPTPFPICLMMAEMTSNDSDEQTKYKAVYEPCAGAGALLLAASNHYLQGYAQDISLTAVLATKVQCHWYAPWYADPQPQLFEFLETEETIHLEEWLEELPLFDIEV